MRDKRTKGEKVKPTNKDVAASGSARKRSKYAAQFARTEKNKKRNIERHRRRMLKKGDKLRRKRLGW